MYKLITLFLITLSAQLLMAQTSYTITPVDFIFSPSELTVNVGDTLFFDGSATHPVQQVSENNWNNNIVEPLDNGFVFSSGVGSFIAEEAMTYYYVCTNHGSSGMKGEITATTATNALTQEALKVDIYPVPVLKGQPLYIRSNYDASEKINLIIYNSIGVQLLEQSHRTRSTMAINTNDLKTGIYLLQIKGGNKTATQRFVVE